MNRKQNLPLELASSNQAKTPQEKQDLVDTISQGIPALNIYKNAIEDKLRKIRKTKETDYDSPSWAYLQADRNGYTRALEEILNLIPRPDGEE